MKFNEDRSNDFAAIGTQILQFWKDNSIFEQSIALREGGTPFTFYEGPPSANGTPGIHHVMARAVKDIFCRYKTMKGYQVKRKAGWDTHGLPVELQVEKQLGITKEDIGDKITVEEYNQHCRQAVMRYTNEWNQLTEKIGFWLNLNDPYITYENNYIESVWHLLKQLHQKGLLYKGYTIQPYSPAAGTGLSSHELNLPGCYRDVKDTSMVAQFKVTDTPNEFLLAWTTTPWTLPSNSALAVGEKIIYLKIQTFNQYTLKPINVWIAKELVGKYFKAELEGADINELKNGQPMPWKVVDQKTGAELAGTTYEQLMPYVEPAEDAFRVIIGDFVSTEDGTGIVHIAPTFGADDFRVAQQNNIPAILVNRADGQEPLVDKQGKFVKEMGEFAGMYVKNYNNANENDPEYKSTDLLIALKLKQQNRAFKIEKYEHSYPHCWRTDKPVLYYPLASWFVKTTAFKDRLVELNNTINWKPQSTGTGRFGNWLANLVDWNLSRSRFWGTPLPIWRTEDGKHEVCIGSVQELKTHLAEAAKSKALIPDEQEQNLQYLKAIEKGDFDLHRPFIDNAVLISPENTPMYRETDLIDVWFDSGAMPYAQWHYPFENHDVFAANYPADFIAEGVDQTRGWFFTLHTLATMLFDQVAFKNVIANGLVLDKNGNKMSKRLGNAVNPFEVVNKYGPDATRWYMIVNAPPWDNLKFDIEGVLEIQRKFLATLQNTYNFFALYANLDGFTFAEGAIPTSQMTESDRWILSKLNRLVQLCDEAYADYDATRAGRMVQEFLNDDLSNWYVRLNRKRFWKSEYNTDKIAAYQTLYTCLETISRLAAPIAPFYTDKLFTDLNNTTTRSNVQSVHLADFPKVDAQLLDAELEERVALARQVVTLVHSLRKKENIRVRQPLPRILIPVLTPQTRKQLAQVEDLILTEVNVKNIEYVEDTDGVVTKKAKPNFKVLGKRLGPRMKAFTSVVNQWRQTEIKTLESQGNITFEVAGEPMTFELADFEILSQDMPGWTVASENGVTVALDIHITESLRREGIARDFVNRMQNLRKEKGFAVQDKIEITVGPGTESEVCNALSEFADYVCAEVQALTITQTDAPLPMPETLDLEGLPVEISVTVVG